jgi:hypothetical protein
MLGNVIGRLWIPGAEYDPHADVWAGNNLNFPFFNHIAPSYDVVFGLWKWVIARVGFEVEVLNLVLVRPQVGD